MGTGVIKVAGDLIGEEVLCPVPGGAEGWFAVDLKLQVKHFGREARREELVGRRREIQRVLRAFRDDARGVLVHGMGAHRHPRPRSCPAWPP